MHLCGQMHSNLFREFYITFSVTVVWVQWSYFERCTCHDTVFWRGTNRGYMSITSYEIIAWVAGTDNIIFEARTVQPSALWCTGTNLFPNPSQIITKIMIITILHQNSVRQNCNIKSGIQFEAMPPSSLHQGHFPKTIWGSGRESNPLTSKHMHDFKAEPHEWKRKSNSLIPKWTSYASALLYATNNGHRIHTTAPNTTFTTVIIWNSIWVTKKMADVATHAIAASSSFWNERIWLALSFMSLCFEFEN